MGATLRPEGAVEEQPDELQLAQTRGDAILYLSDPTDVADALVVKRITKRKVRTARTARTAFR
jgi:hypothetical protein